MAHHACPACGHPNVLPEGALPDASRCQRCAWPLRASGEARYYIAQGQNVQGPYLQERVRELIRQGTVRSSMQFSLEGGPWLPGSGAPELFPTDAASPPPPPPPRKAAPGRAEPPAYDPYVDAFEDEPRRRSRRPLMDPHRGVLILVLGICAFVVCGPLGIPAWVMGNEDLRKMDRGRMDPSGRGMTQAGRILGIIWCALAGLGLLIALVVLAVGSAAVWR